MSDPNESEASPTPSDKGAGGSRRPSACSRLSDTPETAAVFRGNGSRRAEDWIAQAEALAVRLERERDELRAWALEAAPMLSNAAGIVADEWPNRLSEIQGVRAILELCPVDSHSENSREHPRA